MDRKRLFLAALAFIAGAAVLFLISSWRGNARRARPGFVQTENGRFVIDGRPFRFVGANVSVIYRDDDRARMPETLRRAARVGIKVVRVWASGEGGPNDVKPIADFNDWPRTHSFRNKPNEWNEAEFVFLDQVLAEAARNNLHVQLCLTNWWRDTGGVTQYLRWAGINGADDDKFPFGINDDKAMQFYTNGTARQLYREHLQKIAARRNSVTGVLYRDAANGLPITLCRVSTIATYTIIRVPTQTFRSIRHRHSVILSRIVSRLPIRFRNLWCWGNSEWAQMATKASLRSIGIGLTSIRPPVKALAAQCFGSSLPISSGVTA